MGKLPFSQEYLLETYKKDLNEMLDVCDWKSHVEDYDICDIVANICRKNKVKISSSVLLDLYEAKIKSLNLKDGQWQAEYGSWETGVPKIIAMIYEILENYHK